MLPTAKTVAAGTYLRAGTQDTHPSPRRWVVIEVVWRKDVVVTLRHLPHWASGGARSRRPSALHDGGFRQHHGRFYMSPWPTTRSSQPDSTRIISASFRAGRTHLSDSEETSEREERRAHAYCWIQGAGRGGGTGCRPRRSLVLYLPSSGICVQ